MNEFGWNKQSLSFNYRVKTILIPNQTNPKLMLYGSGSEKGAKLFNITSISFFLYIQEVKEFT